MKVLRIPYFDKKYIGVLPLGYRFMTKEKTSEIDEIKSKNKNFDKSLDYNTDTYIFYTGQFLPSTLILNFQEKVRIENIVNE